MDKEIGIIGCGNMGGAIATALAKAGTWDLHLYSKTGQSSGVLAKKLSCDQATSLEDVMDKSDCLILAVKPQVLPSLYGPLQGLGSETKRWISVAAGVPLATLVKNLHTGEVVRFMPNIAAKVGSSVTAMAAAETASKELEEEAVAIARSFGSCFPLAESQFSAFIGISGSAIAYVFQFLHALAMGGVEQGIPYSTALSIARDTCLGAAALQKETGQNAVELATSVCSAGGTTIRGMKALADGAFDATVANAVEKAAVMSRKMEEAARNDG